MVGQNWKVDDCTTCYCQRDGKIACAVQMCNGYPGCPNPVKEKGHCCPVCPEEPEEDLVSSENEGKWKQGWRSGSALASHISWVRLGLGITCDQSLLVLSIDLFFPPSGFSGFLPYTNPNTLISNSACKLPTCCPRSTQRLFQGFDKIAGNNEATILFFING